MSNQDLRMIARKVVRESLNLRRGESVLISGLPGTTKLMDMIAAECHLVGTFPLIWLKISDASFKTVLTKTSIENLSVTPKQLVAMMDGLDAYIMVTGIGAWSWREGIDSEVVAAIEKWFDPMFDKIIQRRIKWCTLTGPFSENRRRNIAVTKALKADYEYMTKLGKKLQAFLTGAESVRITNKAGTDLKFKIGERPVIVDDGILDEEDLKRDFQVYVPGGVVCVEPIEESANGTVVIGYAYNQTGRYRGVIRNLRLVFENGKIIESKAKAGYSLFKRVMDEATGDKDCFAEFGIGINPEVKWFIDVMRVDELMHGSTHIAIGDNSTFSAFYGGKNVSNIHWDFIIQNSSVKVGHKLILDNGNFVI